MEFRKSHPSTNSWPSKLYVQISVHMSIVPGPASQNAVIKCELASPGLQCMAQAHKSCFASSQARAAHVFQCKNEKRCYLHP